MRSLLLLLVLVPALALCAAAQEPYWCDSCDEAQGEHSATCPERPRQVPEARPRRPAPEPPARALLRAASASARAGRDEEAIGLYREALAHEPERRGAWRNLGNALWRARRYAEAEAAYEEAAARRPGLDLAASLARLRRAAREAEDQRRRTTLWREAVASYRAGEDLATLQALALLPEPSAATWELRGQSSARLGWTPEALAAYREALLLEEDPAERARLEERRTELLRSRRSAELRQRRLDLGALSAARAEAGRVDEALDLLQAALPDEPSPRWIYERLGRLSLERRPLRGAARAEWALRRALGLNPERASAWTNLGVLYDRLGHDGRALRCYRRALELDASLEELRARAEVLAGARPQPSVEAPAQTWLRAPSLLGSEPLPLLDLEPLRAALLSAERAAAPAPGQPPDERALVLRFDPTGALRASRERIGPPDPTLIWLRDHGSAQTWPELEAPLPRAEPLDLEGARGWRFD